jgi:Holliday junction resolvasome RuvABC endonuclease subunit
MTLLKLDGALSPDAADAVGVALCHAYSRQTQHALAHAVGRGRRA